MKHKKNAHVKVDPYLVIITCGETRAVTERQTPGDTQPEFSLTIYLHVFFITIYLRKANSLYPLLLVLTYFPGDTRPEFSLTSYLLL